MLKQHVNPYVSFGNKIKWKKLKEPTYNIIVGLWDTKNRLSAKYPLDMTHKREMVITDLDYFVVHYKEILAVAEKLIEVREKDRRGVRCG